MLLLTRCFLSDRILMIFLSMMKYLLICEDDYFFKHPKWHHKDAERGDQVDCKTKRSPWRLNIVQEQQVYFCNGAGSFPARGLRWEIGAAALPQAPAQGTEKEGAP